MIKDNRGKDIDRRSGNMYRNFLDEHNCDVLQGYFFSKPLPYEQLIKSIQKSESEISCNNADESRFYCK